MDALVEVELTDALALEDCAICRIGERSAASYLTTVLHECVNDVATRKRLLAAWGFCRRHAWHFLRLESLTMHDALGTAILGEGLVEAVQLVLDSEEARPSLRPGAPRRERAKRLQHLQTALLPAAECPACSQQREREVYALGILVRLLRESTWQARVSSSAGLCLAHLRTALTEVDAPDELDWLLTDHRQRFIGLVEDLKEYIRKRDYRFVGEPPGREIDAFRRATAALAGTWFGLPGPPVSSSSPLAGSDEK